MPLPGFTLDADRLGRHARALRRLAYALVRDDDLAEDLVQETWMASLRSPPDPDRPLRPWLYQVLRNLVRAGHRTDARRRQREEAFTTAATAASPSPEEGLGRAQLTRLVADLVLALEEPFRSTVILRYLEGRSAIDIAREQNLPPSTVRSRAMDGLERIRAELDRRHGGDRKAWRFALLPLAGVGGRPEPVGAATSAGSNPLGAGLAAFSLVAVVLTASWWLLRKPSGPTVSAIAPGNAALEIRPPGAWSPPNPGALPARPQDPVPGHAAPAGLHLRGRVLDASRIPLAGAVVTAERKGNRLRAVTDESGRFELALPAGRHRLRAVAPGFAAGAQQVELASDASTDFFLDPGAIVQGRVVLRGSGDAVPEATVLLLDRARGLADSPRATTDGEGRFELHDLEAGRYLPVARRNELTGQVETLEVAAAARLSDVVIEVEPGATVAGRVRGDRGQPLANAVFSLGLLPFTGAWEWTRTDRAGRFTVAGVLPGRYWVSARSEGYLPRQQRDLVVEGAGPRLELSLERGASVRGKVVDDRGRPLAGAIVNAVDEMNTLVGHAAARPDGSFELTDLASGALRLVLAQPERRAVAETRVHLGPEGLSGLVLSLARPASVSGRVRWQDGEPVAGAIVSASRARGAHTRKSTSSGTDGRFELTGLSPGQYTVDARLGVFRVDVAGRYGDNLGRRTIDLAAGQEVQEIALVLARLDRELTGTVVDPEGQPLAGAIVTAAPVDGRGHPLADNLVVAAEAERRYRVASGADGSFRIEQLPAGPVWITAEDPTSRRRRNTTAPAGTRDLRLEIPR